MLILQIFLSLLLIACSQGSSFLPYLHFGVWIGFALFWDALFRISPSAKIRFWLAFAWFTVAQMAQYFWVTSVEYVGPFMLVVYIVSMLIIGAQFGALSWFLGRYVSFRRSYGLAIAGMWVLLEWSRTCLFYGFHWNLTGLSLGSFFYPLQLASIFGVYGLSFCVFLVNVFLFQEISVFRKTKSWLCGVKAACFIGIPFLLGWLVAQSAEGRVKTGKSYSAVLVQTALFPEQKDPMQGSLEAFIPPLNQWERIWNELKDKKNIDLVILPEAAVCLSAHRSFYPFSLTKEIWENSFGEGSLEGNWQETKVDNAFLAQALANHLRATVIIGLDDQELGKKYNAAFCFYPDGRLPERYDKRVLVPIGEYVPFSGIRAFSSFLLKQFGIGDSFSEGAEAKLFSFDSPIGISICMEEIQGSLIRELRQKGAAFFINIFNDVWFPQSKLPEMHLLHGRIRSIENGVCALRSGNTGISCGIDYAGRVFASLPPNEQAISSIQFSFPVRSVPTLYSWWGDAPILAFSGLMLSRFLIRKREEKQSLALERELQN